MKIIFNENPNCFSIDLKPENVEEAAQLLRLSSMAKREIIDFKTYFNENFYCNFYVDKVFTSYNRITSKTKIKD